MLKTYQNSSGVLCVAGTPEDLDFVTALTRARLYALLGPERGEAYFRKLPAFSLLKRVTQELSLLGDN